MCVRCGKEEVNENGEESVQYFCDLCKESIKQQIDCYHSWENFENVCFCWKGFFNEQFYNEQPISCNNAEWCWQEYKGNTIQIQVDCSLIVPPSRCLGNWLCNGLQCICTKIVSYTGHEEKTYVLMLNKTKLIKNARK